MRLPPLTVTAVTALAALAAVAACVPPVDIPPRPPCPCAAGYQCCYGDFCVADGDECPAGACPLPPVDEPALAIGEGSEDDVRFRPLPDGGRLVLHSGIQGGYHVYVQLRALGIEPERMTLVRRLRDPDTGAELRLQQESVNLACPEDEEAWILAQGQLLFVCPSLTAGADMQGRDLLLEVELRDAADRTLQAQAVIHPVCPEGDEVCAEDTDVGCAGAAP